MQFGLKQPQAYANRYLYRPGVHTLLPENLPRRLRREKLSGKRLNEN